MSDDLSEGLADELAAHRHGRVPRDLRRRQVVEVASALFAEAGFAGASMDELARRVGVSKPVIYDLVGSKEELFTVVTDRFAKELGDRVLLAVTGGDLDDRRRLEAGATAFFEFVAEREGAWAALGVAGAGPPAQGLDEVRRRQAELVTALLAEWFRRGAERTGRDAPDGATVEALAHALNGAFEAVAIWWRTHRDRTPQDLARLVADLAGPGLERFAGG